MRKNPPADSIRIFAPAKINLFLKVFPIDERGYHPLHTIFQAVGLWDELHVSLGETAEVTFDVAGIPAQNTVTRAIELYARETDVPPIKVHVIKKIPTESGLGGGSSDAAAVLRALQHLLGDPLSTETLERIALQVGADVPFFLMGGQAVAEGYGEKLASLPPHPPTKVILTRPNEGCSTGEMFRKLDELGVLPTDSQIRNDFELVAPQACLDLIERLRVLGAYHAALSGSGSAVFGLFEEPELSATAYAQLREEGVPWLASVRTLTRAECFADSP